MKAGTIYALASGAGKAGIAVLRISGDAAESIFDNFQINRPLPRAATRCSLRNPGTDELLDQGLVLWFPSPHSFTGEDVVELHVHGGRAVVDGILSALSAMTNFRLAEPGEFTRRAFENNKMDLTAAEGLADLVDAETSAQRDQALRQMQGALGDLYEDWRTRLLRASAYLETTIDFAEEDIPNGLEADVRSQVGGLKQNITAHLRQGHQGERLREGVRVALLGAPNAGKSSLLNQLAARDVAIVSSVAGTTRDVIEVHLDLAGIPVILADTAGIRQTSEQVEVEGVRRALSLANEVDYKIIVLDPSDTPLLSPDVVSLIDANTLLVINKADLGLSVSQLPTGETITLSALTGAGIQELVELLSEKVRTRFNLTEQPSLTRARHRTALEDCLVALNQFEALPSLIEHPELAAENLRAACVSLGHITGRVDVEDLLDVIFRDFCIGK